MSNWNRDAYLILVLNKTGNVPTFNSLMIASERAVHLTQSINHIYSDVMTMKGESYDDAYNKMIKYIMDTPSMEWARIWVQEDPRSIVLQQFMASQK